MHKFVLAGFILLVFSCRSGKNTPDVSHIKVPLSMERFEKAFFTLDTLHTDQSLQRLNEQYPGFTKDFLFNILGTTPDSAIKDVPFFIRTYAAIAKDADKKFASLDWLEKEVKQGFQLIRHYFPSYQLPTRLITFMGPVNSYGNIITPDALAVGLQLYMGRQYPLYLTEQGMQLYPAFISRRFEPEYMAANCIKNIVDDMYPAISPGRPLIEQMVESGKRLYLLRQLMPAAADTITTGYTAKQLEGCYQAEKQIWSFFVQNNLLYTIDPDTIRDYMTDGPNTVVFGDASPGLIGQFVGMQIVTKWVEKNKTVTMDALMKTPARQVFEEAKYKP